MVGALPSIPVANMNWGNARTALEADASAMPSMGDDLASDVAARAIGRQVTERAHVAFGRSERHGHEASSWSGPGRPWSRTAKLCDAEECVGRGSCRHRH